MLKNDDYNLSERDNPVPLEVSENASYKFIYRLKFKKKGQAKFISHLDLVRTMTRAVRRAKLPIWYTEGFNRHPYLTFASPLSLGFEGACESMDLRFVEDISPEEVLLKLNEVLPEGLEIISAAQPVFKVKELSHAIYNASIVSNKLGVEFSNIDFLDFQNQEEIYAEKLNKKKRVITVDLKKCVDCAKIFEVEDTQFHCSIIFEMQLPCGSNENINPNLIVDSFLSFIKIADKTSVSVSIVREKLFAGSKLFI